MAVDGKIEDKKVIAELNTEEKEVSDVVKLCEGNSNSNGAIVETKKGAFYITNTQPDLKEIIGKINELIDQVGILAETVAVTGSPLAPAVKGAVDSIKADLETTKETLI